MARCSQGVALIVIAMLVAFGEAGYYQRRAMKRELLSPPPLCFWWRSTDK